MKHALRRLALGAFAVTLVAAGLTVGQAPAQATNDPYVLIAGDIACDASTWTGNVNHAVDPNHCQQGATAALFDPLYNKGNPVNGHGVGYFTSAGTYGSNPERVVVAGDMQYDDGFKMSANYAGTAGAIDSDTYCSGPPTAAGPNGDCSFDQTWGLAASSNTTLSTKVNDGIIAEPGDHDWQEGLAGNAGQNGCASPCYDSKRTWASCTYDDFPQSSGDPKDNQACGYQSYFQYPNSNGNYYDWENNATTSDEWGSFVDQVPCTGTGCSPLVLVMVDTGACTGAVSAEQLCQPGGQIADWLKTTLADTTANPNNACTVVVSYAARYADFHHGDTAPQNGQSTPDISGVTAAMYPYDATTNPDGYHGNASQLPDLVVSGHDHGYERLKAVDQAGNVPPTGTNKGIRQVTIGTGGETTNPQPLTGDVNTFPAGNTAWGYDYWTNSGATTPNDQAADPGVEQFSWSPTNSTWSATHYYMLDENNGGTPSLPNAGDSVTNVACH